MKKRLLVLVALVLISCQQITNKSIVDNEKLIQKYFEHFNNQDWPQMADMYIENAEFKDISLGLGIVKQTKQQIIDKYSQLHQLFPD